MSGIPTGSAAHGDEGGGQAAAQPFPVASEPDGAGCDDAHSPGDQAPDGTPPTSATAVTEAAGRNITGDRNVVGHGNTVISGDGNTTSFT